MAVPLTPTNTLEQRRKIKRWSISLCAIVVMMFVFAIWVMPPFYDAICRLTGLNGKVAPATVEDLMANESTTSADNTNNVKTAPVNVQLVTDTDPGMPWSFQADMRSVRIAPGKQQLVTFTVHNPTNTDMVGQAIPSVTPAQAMSHIKKIECFCFQRQELKAGETRQLSMVFYIDKDLPQNVPTVTLAYKFFDITHRDPTAS